MMVMWAMLVLSQTGIGSWTPLNRSAHPGGVARRWIPRSVVVAPVLGMVAHMIMAMRWDTCCTRW